MKRFKRKGRFSLDESKKKEELDAVAVSFYRNEQKLQTLTPCIVQRISKQREW